MNGWDAVFLSVCAAAVALVAARWIDSHMVTRERTDHSMFGSWTVYKTRARPENFPPEPAPPVWSTRCRPEPSGVGTEDMVK